jgi:hypothetical protein
LQAAEAAAQEGQFAEALEQAAKAFRLSLRHHRFGEPPRLFDPTNVAYDVRRRGWGIDEIFRDLSGSLRPFEAVAQMGESLGDAITRPIQAR